MTEKMLILGGAGYLGHVLVEKLLGSCESITIFDLLHFGKSPEDSHQNLGVKLERKDVRNLNENDFRNYEIVIDLAGISNDPSSVAFPLETAEVNVCASIRNAQIAKSAGVKAYLFASSCSVYGGHQGAICNEHSQLLPLTAYAQSKALADVAIASLNDNRFRTVCLRLATLYGISHSMRFDLFINSMTYSAHFENIIPVNGNGEQLRPIVSVLNVAQAFYVVLKEIDRTPNIINVVECNGNLRISHVAEIISHLTHAPIVHAGQQDDERSYGAKSEGLDVLGCQLHSDLKAEVKRMFDSIVDGKIKKDDASLRLDALKSIRGKG